MLKTHTPNKQNGVERGLCLILLNVLVYLILRFILFVLYSHPCFLFRFLLQFLTCSVSGYVNYTHPLHKPRLKDGQLCLSLWTNVTVFYLCQRDLFIGVEKYKLCRQSAKEVPTIKNPPWYTTSFVTDRCENDTCYPPKYRLRILSEVTSIMCFTWYDFVLNYFIKLRPVMIKVLDTF